jgi:PDZ domain-containing protein
VRRVVLLASAGIVLAAVTLVPLPLVELSPGPTIDVPNVVTFTSHPAQKVNGKVLATTVLLSRPRAPDLVASWFVGHHEILRQRQVVPSGVSESRYLRYERQVFTEAARTGAAVGLRAAGLPVTATGGGARVAAVVKGSPADGRLHVGDVVTAADGKPVHFSADLVAATAGKPAGTVVFLTVEHNGVPSEMQLQLRRLDQLGRAALGVEVVSVAPQIELPFPVDVRVNDVGGPSAGLMVALATYDLATPADIVGGRIVAGTGTIDINGNVGAVGGVAEKVAGAEYDKATIFLAPADEAAEARRAAGNGIRVVAVKTFADALHALGATAG